MSISNELLNFIINPRILAPTWSEQETGFVPHGHILKCHISWTLIKVSQCLIFGVKQPSSSSIPYINKSYLVRLLSNKKGESYTKMIKIGAQVEKKGGKGLTKVDAENSVNGIELFLSISLIHWECILQWKLQLLPVKKVGISPFHTPQDTDPSNRMLMAPTTFKNTTYIRKKKN